MLDTCEICGAPLTDAGSVPGYQAPGVYRIFECVQCRTMVASPKEVDPKVYEAIYSVPGGPPGYDRNFQYAKHVLRAKDPLQYLASRQDAFWGVHSALQECGARRILEIGSGLGYLTYALRRAGYDAFGVDISREATAKARSTYGDFYCAEAIESYASKTSNRFDSIVMVEVLEHLEHPVETMEAALQLLADDGVLILTTPNRTFFGYDQLWATDLPPVHLWWFSESSIEIMAERVGRSVKMVDFTHYNARFPILYNYRTPLTPMFDSGGSLVRRESFPIAVLRRSGILQDAYWLATRAAGIIQRRISSRRPTLVAMIKAKAHV